MSKQSRDAAAEQQQPNLPPGYHVDEVARALRVREQRVRELIHQGKLKAHRYGLRLVVFEDDLRAFLDAHVADAGPDKKFGRHLCKTSK